MKSKVKKLKKLKGSGYENISLKTIPVTPSKTTRLAEVYKIAPEQIRDNLAKMELQLRSKEEEHAYVYTPSGVVYHFIGDDECVDPRIIGAKKLEGSITTHNHTNENGPSRADFIFSAANKIAETRVVSSKQTFILKVKPYHFDITGAGFAYAEALGNTVNASYGAENENDLTMQELTKLFTASVEYRKEF